MRQKRGAIALLITVMFVIVITVAIGFGLKQVNKASSLVAEENFMYQSQIIIEDVVKILQTSKDIQLVADANTSDALFILISQAGFIPFESNGLEIVLKIKSARGKFNPAQLDTNRTTLLKQYMNNKRINSEYVDILLDNIGGIKEDNSYNSRIFDEKPYLFRDYIASSKHLKEINDFYTKEYSDNALADVDFNNLFYYSSDTNMSLDLNYVTTEVWEMILTTSKERAELLSAGMGSYTTVEDLALNDDELENLSMYKYSFFEPILFVELELTQNTKSSRVTFEYDIKEKKGSNFVYEI